MRQCTANGWQQYLSLRKHFISKGRELRSDCRGGENKDKPGGDSPDWCMEQSARESQQVNPWESYRRLNEWDVMEGHGWSPKLLTNLALLPPSDAHGHCLYKQ